jgi:RNA polymerase sigma-70 factor (ECF subfamily)
LDYTSFDDAALVRLIAASRTEALGVLYDRYGRLVYSIAMNATGDSTASEEITQDVFMRVWEKARTYDVDLAKVSTWLVAITRNRSIDELRRRNVRLDQAAHSWAELPDIPDARNGPIEEQISAAWEARQVQKALSELPEEQKKALALAYFEGLSHSEISAALGEPLGTVKTRIRLAMQKLKDLLVEQASLQAQAGKK